MSGGGGFCNFIYICYDALTDSVVFLSKGYQTIQLHHYTTYDVTGTLWTPWFSPAVAACCANVLYLPSAGGTLVTERKNRKIFHFLH